MCPLFFRQLFLAVPRDGCITTPTVGLLFLLGECTAHSAGIPVGLIYHCIIYKPRLPPDATAAGSNQLMAEASVRSAAEPAGSMIDWRID